MPTLVPRRRAEKKRREDWTIRKGRGEDNRGKEGNGKGGVGEGRVEGNGRKKKGTE